MTMNRWTRPGAGRSTGRLAVAGALLGLSLVAIPAWAQPAWPARPIRIIVPTSPGAEQPSISVPRT